MHYFMLCDFVLFFNYRHLLLIQFEWDFHFGAGKVWEKFERKSKLWRRKFRVYFLKCTHRRFSCFGGGYFLNLKVKFRDYEEKCNFRENIFSQVH